MGATLPMLVSYLFRGNSSVGVSIGSLYFWNTMGAATGAFAAGVVADFPRPGSDDLSRSLGEFCSGHGDFPGTEGAVMNMSWAARILFFLVGFISRARKIFGQVGWVLLQVYRKRSGLSSGYTY